jgi:pimeloyl-ACP methyl ester carboxylesterase
MTTRTAATRRLDRLGEGSIAYDVQGAGPLVVLVPGMGELRSTYRFLAPALVAAGHTVVTTDLRGHGESDATFSGYGDVDTAGDVEALVRELGEPAVIVGNSMSAGSAVIVAAEHPELVRGLVLVGPFVRNPAASAFVTAMFRVMMARPWVATMWGAYLPTLYSGAKPADFAAEKARALASIRRPGFARAFSLTTRTDHAPAEAALAAVTAPTLVVMGEEDPDFRDQAGEASWIATTLRGRAVMVPDAGHYPHVQQPEVTTEAVVAFLGELATAGGSDGSGARA